MISLRRLRTIASSEKLIGHSPEKERHFLFYKFLEDFSDLEVELQKSDSEGLVGFVGLGHFFQKFGVFVLECPIEDKMGNFVVLSTA